MTSGRWRRSVRITTARPACCRPAGWKLSASRSYGPTPALRDCGWTCRTPHGGALIWVPPGTASPTSYVSRNLPSRPPTRGGKLTSTPRRGGLIVVSPSRRTYRLWESGRMSADSLRAVELSRLSRLHFQATNSRGGTLSFGDSEAGEFTSDRAAAGRDCRMHSDGRRCHHREKVRTQPFPGQLLRPLHQGHGTAIALPISTSTSMSSSPTPRAGERLQACWRSRFASLMIDSAP